MSWLTDWFTDWLNRSLIDAIMERFDGMYDSINARVGEIAVDVGQTPESWNSDVYSMIRTLSETAVIPIAGMILTFVMCHELISMIIERNNMHDFEIFNLYKWIFKTFAAVYILTHTFDIVMGVFGLAQQVIGSSAGVIRGSLNVGAGSALADLRVMLEAMGTWELIGLWLETFIVSLCLQIMTVVIFIIIFGRMIEIYLTVSVAPIPLATMANREWGQIGNNYLKSLFALAFQGFLIMVCVAIYAVLVQNIPSSGNAHAAIWTTAGHTALLSWALLKSGSLAKSVFSAH
ncbi:MAG: hypothetical protein LBP73_04030 [Clostridiales Family XIII bacterium]|jgi:hypothetical protein|nr:hypothetical protein [Clostridiales Family XIII bacterium]